MKMPYLSAVSILDRRVKPILFAEDMGAALVWLDKGGCPMRFLLLAVAALIGLSGCSISQDKAAAEAGVARFRQQLDAGRYQEIYRTGGPEFRGTGSEEAGTRFLQTVHDRLGAVRNAQQTGWRVNFNSGGSVAVLNYETEFARGRGTEEFVFRLAEGQPTLIGYHVNSDALRSGSSPAAAAPGDTPQ
jgi:hypothetical protein